MIKWILLSILLISLIIIYKFRNENKKLSQKLNNLSLTYNKIINENKRLLNENKILQHEYDELSDKDTLVNNYLSLKKKLKTIEEGNKFLATFEDIGINTINDYLNMMVKRAKKEIIIVSPYITLKKFDIIFSGFRGNIEVFTKYNEEDFSKGYSKKEILTKFKENGVKVYCSPKIHAKIYFIDQKEAIITSANFTGGGISSNYESGIWTCNPSIIHEIGDFIKNLRNVSSLF